jgi:hypothetical protein
MLCLVYILPCVGSDLQSLKQRGPTVGMQVVGGDEKGTQYLGV